MILYRLSAALFAIGAIAMIVGMIIGDSRLVSSGLICAIGFGMAAMFYSYSEEV